MENSEIVENHVENPEFPQFRKDYSMNPYTLRNLEPRCCVCGRDGATSMVPIQGGASVEMCASCRSEMESGALAIEWVDTPYKDGKGLTYRPMSGHWEAVRGSKRTRLGACLTARTKRPRRPRNLRDGFNNGLGYKRPITVDGVRYESMAEAIEGSGFCESALRCRIEHRDGERFVDTSTIRKRSRKGAAR